MYNRNPRKEKVSLRNVVDRLGENTPPFWRKVRRIGLAVGAIGGAIVATAATGGLTAPAAMITIAKAMITIGASVVAVSSATSEER